MKQSKKICIIDDDSICTVILKKNIALLNESLPVATYTNGLEALHVLQQALDKGEPLHCTILLDINMPVMDGWEFLETFTKLTEEAKKDISVYIMSSSIDYEDKARTAAYSVVKSYLVKPIGKHIIQDIIDKL
jgi:CheY-like chemotaxis protein